MKAFVHIWDGSGLFDSNVSVIKDFSCRPVKGDEVYLDKEDKLAIAGQIQEAPARLRYSDCFDVEGKVDVSAFIYVARAGFISGEDGQAQLHIQLSTCVNPFGRQFDAQEDNGEDEI